MFMGTKDVDGKEVPRFKEITDLKIIEDLEKIR